MANLSIGGYTLMRFASEWSTILDAAANKRAAAVEAGH